MDQVNLRTGSTNMIGLPQTWGNIIGVLFVAFCALFLRILQRRPTRIFVTLQGIAAVLLERVWLLITRIGLALKRLELWNLVIG